MLQVGWKGAHVHSSHSRKDNRGLPEDKLRGKSKWVWCVACRAEKEAVEQRRADLASALQQRKASKRAGLQSEPVAGTNTTAIRIRLPDGSTAQRRFLADEPLQVQKARGCTCLIHSNEIAVLLTMTTSMSCCQNIMVGNVVFLCRLSTILPILWKA